MSALDLIGSVAHGTAGENAPRRSREHAIRGPVVGRKNHYIEPAVYLLAAVRAADRGEALLPWQYAAQR